VPSCAKLLGQPDSGWQPPEYANVRLRGVLITLLPGVTLVVLPNLAKGGLYARTLIDFNSKTEMLPSPRSKAGCFTIKANFLDWGQTFFKLFQSLKLRLRGSGRFHTRSLTFNCPGPALIAARRTIDLVFLPDAVNQLITARKQS